MAASLPLIIRDPLLCFVSWSARVLAVWLGRNSHEKITLTCTDSNKLREVTKKNFEDMLCPQS